MLSQRQLEVLLELCENQDRFMTAAYFADKQQVSIRTIQNDIKAIKSALEEYPCATFQSSGPRGSRIVVHNEMEFETLKENLYQQFGKAPMAGQNERVNEILLLLLRQHRSISYYDVENAAFVSHSTLVGDLKQIDRILQKYHLELMHGSNKIAIDGGEINKRRCISEENLLVANATSMLSEDHTDERLSKIKDILVETFVACQHNVSEVELNNMILTINVALDRMQNWFFISPGEIEHQAEMGQEREIAAAICARLEREYHLNVPDAEIDFLALYLKGRSNASNEVISQEIDDLVLDGLREIRNNSGIDLTNDLNLRISLALHCTQLVVRVKYSMQMNTRIVSYIRQSFPQGFDLATYFAAYLQTRLGKRIYEEEIAFIAIHLYKGLLDLQKNTGTKRVLLISSLRRSENILIRQTLYKWFGDQIAELFVIPPSEMNETYLEKYDTFLTTEKGKYYDMGLAFYINPFPNQQDYLNLRLAMDGFESINDILEIFNRDLFEVFRKEMGRDDAIGALCKKSSLRHDLQGLYEAVIEREKLGSTFFGNGIAAVHPIFPVSSDTFIAVGVSPQSIVWDDEGNKVGLILLVCIGKNNAKAFQLWNYLSKLFADKSFISRLSAQPTYEQFLKLLRGAISEDFNP